MKKEIAEEEVCSMIKNARDAGADQRTPSIPQYFSWINNTNEGATETQTLVNLEFFRYMKETYGMQIKIYAWDAGNFDGSVGGYGNVDGEKFRTQYPEGYRNVVEAAARSGIRMGLWAGPDGFGCTPEEEKARFDFFVHLCRDYHFALFKIDGVCGPLRKEKAGVYARMLQTCREYSPDLIVLNHRLALYEAEPYVTTFLWNGMETYTDVFAVNPVTAMHNRASLFSRGHVPGLSRLSEDHGVCLSSSLDYFEDELVYQAFNRSLILAPEIYGNPWLLRDDELPKLARVYNLHRRNAAILVDGMLLPEETYGCCAAVRGSRTKRFLSTGNNTWETRKIRVPLTREIGLEADGEIYVNLHHPFERHLGCFRPGDTVEVELPPFRAVLLEVAAVDEAEPMLTDCAYEIIRETEDGTPAAVKLLQSAGGEVSLLKQGKSSHFLDAAPCDCLERAPVYLGELDQWQSHPENGEFLYEVSVFPISNDSLERRSLQRSGPTKIPQVQAARDAFFRQETYRYRGCEASAMFDRREDTFFDAQSKCYCDEGLRIDGGCLRVDLGRETDADAVEIVFFAGDEITREVRPQQITASGEYSCDLRHWNPATLASIETVDADASVPVVKMRVHSVYKARGRMMRAVYPIGGKLRYFRLENPMDRIFHLRVLKDGKNVAPVDAHANNLQAPYFRHTTQVLKSGQVQIPEYSPGSFLAVAIAGEHGVEGVYCCAEIDGKYIGPMKRASDFQANMWEHCVQKVPANYTYYIPLPEDCAGKTATVYASFSRGGTERIPCRIYLCQKH